MPKGTELFNDSTLPLFIVGRQCSGEGRITREAFFEVIDEERNKVGDAIFALADAKYENQLEFG